MIAAKPCRYAELHALSNFTFLRGASHPEELVETAAALGYEALAITDECSMSGIVRAHMAAKTLGLKLIAGSELHLRSGRKLVALARNRKGYAALCRLITKARRAADKGSYALTRPFFEDGLAYCIMLWVPDDELLLDAEDHWIRGTFRDRLWIAVELLADGRQQEHLEALQDIGRRLKLPLVASGDVHMHRRSRRVLQDTLTAIREGVTVEQAGFLLYPNGERHLRSLEVLRHFYPAALLEEAWLPLAFTPCVWEGISATSRVCVSAPARSPSRTSSPPGDCPTCTGTRPRSSGSANVVRPSPP